MSLFETAVKKTAVKTNGRKTKNTTWVVGDPAGDDVAKAVHTLVELSAQEKAIAAKKKLAATVVMKSAKENHVRDFSELGVPPNTPMCVQNADGEKVTFVVQDRSGQYDVKPEQVSLLGQLLGEDVVEELVYTEVKLGFDRTVLSLPGVSDAIESALTRAIKKLVKDEVLTHDAAGMLITAKQKTSFKPGTLDRAAVLCGRDTVKLACFLDAMGSSCTRYIKA